MKAKAALLPLARYGLAALMTVVILHGGFHFPWATWDVPVAGFGNDVKEVLARIVNGVFQDQTELLAAPFGFENLTAHSTIYRFLEILTGSLDSQIIWALSLVSHDPVVLANLFYYLSFPLVTLSFLFVARHWGVSYGSALAFGLCYSFLYNHFFRNINHLNLSCYALVPLYVCILLWLTQKRPLFFARYMGRKGVQFFSFKPLCTVIVLLLLAPIDYYYLYFFVLLLPFTVLIRLRKGLTMGHVGSFLIVFLLAAASMYKYVVPDMVYKIIEPQKYAQIKDNKSLVQGSQYISGYGNAEEYALKMSQLLLPVDSHRCNVLAEIKKGYNQHHQTNENTSASLGFLASIAFVWLIGLIFCARNPYSKASHLALLNLACLVVATVGGVGALIPVGVKAMGIDSALLDVRSYNRISMFIACLAFLLLCLGWDHLLYRLKKSRWLPRTFKTLSCLVLSLALAMVSIWDQTPAWDFSKWDLPFEASAFQQDKAFVRLLEQEVEKGAIFQLPATVHHTPPFDTSPEDAFYYTDMYTGYIFSRQLQWSFGADIDSPQFRWYLQTSRLPVSEMLQELGALGFKGILIDTAGYTADENERIRQLKGTLNSEMVRGGLDGRYVFFPLPASFCQACQEAYQTTPEEIKVSILEELSRPRIDFRQYPHFDNIISGWHGQEDGFRWTKDNALVRLDIPADMKPEKLIVQGFSGKIPTVLKVTLNEQRVIEKELRPDQSFHLCADISGLKREAQAWIELKTKGWIPKQLGVNNDPRRLGVAIRALEIKE